VILGHPSCILTLKEEQEAKKERKIQDHDMAVQNLLMNHLSCSSFSTTHSRHQCIFFKKSP